MYCDLHLHTYFSDSTRSPEALAAFARERGVGLVSVCDHDTVDAYRRLRPACEREGLRLIQGAELSANWNGLALHVLGLGFDPGHTGMIRLLRHNQRELERFDDALIANLAEDFPVLSLDDFRRFRRVPDNGGWKNTNYMMARGLAQSVEGGYRYFPQYATYRAQFAPLRQVCDTVIAAGGVPVLAHPGNWWPDPPPDFERTLSGLLREGIRGIECHYPSHSAELTGRCIHFCAQNRCSITAGSDDHGDFNKVVEGVTYELGAVMVDESELNLRGIL